MTEQPLRAASIQFQHRAGDKAYNLGRVQEFASRAAGDGVQLAVFPEMCLTGYWHVRNLSRSEIESLAEPPDGALCHAIRDLAGISGMAIGAGFIECSPDGDLFNSYLVALPDGESHIHRKLHCFISEHMSSGENFTVFDTPFGCRFGVLTCWDNNLLENARMTALLGADVLLAPHQTGGCRSRSPHAMGPIDVALWENRESDPQAIEREFRSDKGRGWVMRWLPARAHDNGMFLVFSNGVGRDDDEVRTGGAMILDCYGRVMAETHRPADEMVIADLDLSMLELCTGRRWMRGRRPELYAAIAERRGDELDPRSVRFSQEAKS